MKHECNVCGAEEESDRRTYVCPWCGEGVMKPGDDDPTPATPWPGASPNKRNEP